MHVPPLDAAKWLYDRDIPHYRSDWFMRGKQKIGMVFFLSDWLSKEQFECLSDADNLSFKRAIPEYAPEQSAHVLLFKTKAEIRRNGK